MPEIGGGMRAIPKDRNPFKNMLTKLRHRRHGSPHKTPQQIEAERTKRVSELGDLRKRYSKVRSIVKPGVEEAQKQENYKGPERQAMQKGVFHTAEKVYPLIMRDELTGLYNRRFFELEADKILDRERRAGRISSILLLDLDGMKLVNDTYGHPKGDEMIIGAGNLITDAVRESDSVIRLGGDEYVVILPNAENGDALKVAEKIRTAIFANLPHNIGLDSEQGNISTTIGLITDHGSLSASDLLHEADIALYNGKYPKDGSQAKNKVVIYQEGMTRPDKIDKRKLNR